MLSSSKEVIPDKGDKTAVAIRNWIDSIPVPVSWIVSALTAAAFICSGMYLWGYWSYFDINFLDYIRFQDVLSGSLLFVLPIIFISIIYVGFTYLPPIRAWFEGEKEKRPRLVFGLPRQLGLFVISMLGFIGAFTLGISSGKPELALILILPFVGSMLGNSLHLIFKHYDYETTSFIGGIVFTILMFCFFAGMARAEHSAKDNLSLTTTAMVSDLEAIISDPVYIGRLGGYVFFSERGYRVTVAIPETRLTAIVTRPNPKKKKLGQD